MSKLVISLLILLVASVAHAKQYGICPAALDDAGSAAPEVSADAFPASIEGLHRFAVERGIGSLSELLSFLPDDMRANYSFMEDTGTDNEASVAFPRMLVFTSDMTFSMAFNTHPAHGEWEQADLMELRDDGRWDFRALHFVESVPTLGTDDSDCRRCHAATPNAEPEADALMVPRWGDYPIWPGAFGDDGARERAGVTEAQAQQLNQWRREGAPDRIDKIVPAPILYRKGLPPMLPDKPGTSALNHINIDLGPRHALSLHRRFQHDADYAPHRYAYLAATYCRSHPAWGPSGAGERVVESASSLGIAPTWQGFWRAFGIAHPEHAVDLAGLPGAAPGRWGDGFDGVQAYTDVLVLNELVQEDPRLSAALESVSDEDTLFSDGCFENKRQALDWVMFFNFSERGLHQVVRQHRRENLRAWRGVIFESREALCPVIFERIAAPAAAAGQIASRGDAAEQ